MMKSNPFAPTNGRLDDDDDECDKDKDGEKGGVAMLGQRLLKKRVVMVTKPVDRDLMAATVAQLLVLDSESHDPITMYINCPGGDADSGFGIYDVMRFVASPITTVCTGLAASAAIIIFLGGDKGSRFSMPNSRFLIHQPSTQSQGQASDLEITANEIIKTRDKYNGIIEDETGVKADAIVTDAHRDFWLSAQEAVDYKLVDKLVANRAELG